MQVTGTVIKVFPQETKGNFTFAKCWVKTNEQYHQTLEVECGGKKADLFNNLNVNDVVTIDINLNGREYNGKVFNKLSAWKLTVDSKGNNVASSAFYKEENDNENLPF